MESRVVITGAGVVSALGVGAESFWHALSHGHTGGEPASSSDASSLSHRKVARVSGFHVNDHISGKSLNLSSRSAQFVCAAAKMALGGAGLRDSSSAADGVELGAVMGTAFGSAVSLLAFDEECSRDGERFVDPMSFPNTVTNSPAGHLSILFGITGLNVTLSTGLASGLDALDYAARVLARGQVRAVVAGGYDEIPPAAPRRFTRDDKRSSSLEPEGGGSAPFDRDRDGPFPGEGAGVLILERLDDALARRAPVLAEVAGIGTSFCLDGSLIVESESEAMARALAFAGLRPQEVGCISASADGSVEGDAAERLAIERTFGDLAGAVPVTAIKSMTGECGAASGVFQVISAALSARFNAVPPTKGFRKPDDGSRLKKISPLEQAADCDVVLVNSFNGRHQNSSVVVRKLLR